jgi:hypothetical protein
MHRPFVHTLTASDRHFISRWLLAISTICGALTLLILGMAIVGQVGTDRHGEIAVMRTDGR